MPALPPAMLPLLAPFAHRNATAGAALAAREPVSSVGTKTKELVGDGKNGGRAWHPAGEPEEARRHDFARPAPGRASRDGVYDHDTARCAVERIRRWWAGAGRARYPGARRLVITADGGGSNGARRHLGLISTILPWQATRGT